jgi:hypothetical protein
MAVSAGKRDRIAVYRAVQNTACCLGATVAAPVVTPDLTKRLMGLMRGGGDPNDLAEGIHPFSMVIMDHRYTATRTVAEHAWEQSRNYDNTTLADASRLRGTKVNVNFDSIFCDAMLKGCYIILCSMLSTEHPVAVQYKHSIDQYANNKVMYMARIDTHFPSHPYVKVARYFQLRLVNWFRNMHTSSALLPPPAFDELLRKLEVDDPTWAPTIPATYLRTPPRTPVAAPTSRQPTTSMASTPVARSAPGATVPAETRLVRSPVPVLPNITTEFVERIANTNITAAIARGSPLHRINHNGRHINMCGRWHLTGQCESMCRRNADHATHSKEESAELITWCRASFA